VTCFLCCSFPPLISCRGHSCLYSVHYLCVFKFLFSSHLLSCIVHVFVLARCLTSVDYLSWLCLNKNTSILNRLHHHWTETGTEYQTRTENGFCSLLAWRLIWINWKRKAAPTHVYQMRDVMKPFEQEKTRFSLKKKEMRQPFIDYFNLLL